MAETTTGAASPSSSDVLQERERLLREMYAASDRWEGDRWPEFVSADVRFRFGNADEMLGREAIAATMDHMRTIVTEIHHDVERLVHGTGDHVTAEVRMHYVRADGTEMRVPAAVVFHFDQDGLIDEYRIYLDPGDFFA